MGVGLRKFSHYYQVSAIAAGDRDAELRERVRAVFDANDETYGRRRIHDELAASAGSRGSCARAGWWPAGASGITGMALTRARCPGTPTTR